MGVTTFIELFDQVMTLKKRLWDLLPSRPEKTQVAALEGTIAALEKRMNLFSPSVLLKEVQAHQELVTLSSEPLRTQVEQLQAQLAEEINQAAQRYERVSQMMTHVDQAHRMQIEQLTRVFRGHVGLLYSLLRFVYPPLRQALIEAADLDQESKEALQQFAQTIDYRPIADEVSLDQLRIDPFFPGWALPHQQTVQRVSPP